MKPMTNYWQHKAWCELQGTRCRDVGWFHGNSVTMRNTDGNPKKEKKSFHLDQFNTNTFSKGTNAKRISVLSIRYHWISENYLLFYNADENMMLAEKDSILLGHLILSNPGEIRMQGKCHYWGKKWRDIGGTWSQIVTYEFWVMLKNHSSGVFFNKNNQKDTSRVEHSFLKDLVMCFITYLAITVLRIWELHQVYHLWIWKKIESMSFVLQELCLRSVKPISQNFFLNSGMSGALNMNYLKTYRKSSNVQVHSDYLLTKFLKI